MESAEHVMGHILEHSLSETLIVVPILFATYLLIEFVEGKTLGKSGEALIRFRHLGPILGGVLGAIPQCGFSAAAATLYAGRVVSAGTLIAVFLSTSDEMIPVFLASQVPLETIARILLAKVMCGVVAGYLIDFLLRQRLAGVDASEVETLCAQDHCHCDSAKHIVKGAVRHTLQVFAFIFLATTALGLCIELAGEDALASVLMAHEELAIALSGVVGLIPNCAASVVIAELYAQGALSSGAMIAGLLSSAGVGLLVLCRSNRRAKENASIVLALLAISVFVGVSVRVLGIEF